MKEYIEVIFRSERKGFFTNTKNFPLAPDQIVICRVDRGEDIGRIINTAISEEEVEDKNAISEILRIANKDDFEQLLIVKKREKDARNKFLSMQEKYTFDMKLLDVVYQFDGNKLIFFFSADGRVDFREFVRELATEFKTRIELHQSSGREDAKRYGGYGICGKAYCCVQFIRKFNQVTIKMAKDQNLLSNLSKISGPCGRLLCCLHFEEEFYLEKAKDFPPIDEFITLHGKKMKVMKNDYYSDMIHLSGEDGNTELLTLTDFMKTKERNKPKKTD